MSCPDSTRRSVPRMRRSRLLRPLASTSIALILLIPILHAAQEAPGTAVADRETVEHVLNRMTFGPRPGAIERVQAIGIEAYIDSQLHPERIADEALEARLAAFPTLDMSSRDLARDYFQPAAEARRQAQASQEQQPGSPAMLAPATGARQAQAAERSVLAELAQAKMLRAVLSERQLQEVLTDFWMNHFNVFAGKGQVRQYLTEYERDAIRPRVLGSFRDLLGTVARSPAMLFYLDNWQSTSESPRAIADELERRLNDPRLSPEQRRQLQNRLQARMQPLQQRPQRGLNENYARELMELHTLGVDGGYTQADVVALARILTGWTIDRPRDGGPFIYRPAMHDTGTKTLLGSTFGSAGQVEGEHALDLLARHPSTARHISFKLAQRFVSDSPPPVLVNRLAAVFTSTGGDLRAVVRALLTSPEFVGPEYRRAKVKTPLEFVASAARATDATIVNPQPLVAALQNLGMPLYGCQPPTGYSMTADAWVNTGALLNRMTFATALVEGGRIVQDGHGRGGNAGQARTGGPGRGRGGLAGAQTARGPIRIAVSALAADVSEPARRALVAALFAGGVSEATARTLARAETPQQLIALTLGSPEFQRR